MVDWPGFSEPANLGPKLASKPNLASGWRKSPESFVETLRQTKSAHYRLLHRFPLCRCSSSSSLSDFCKRQQQQQEQQQQQQGSKTGLHRGRKQLSNSHFVELSSHLGASNCLWRRRRLHSAPSAPKRGKSRSLVGQQFRVGLSSSCSRLPSYCWPNIAARQ